MFRRLPLFCILLLGGVQALQAQLRVELSFKRSVYIIYEPLVATVAITNLAGREITLRDTPETHWFSFEIIGPEERNVPVINADYQLPPLTIPTGSTLKRSIDLTPLYAVREFGLHRVRANIYLSEEGKYFSSEVEKFDLTEGKVIWSQTVGVPEGGPGAPGTRTMSLLTHRLPKYSSLYARVEDREKGTILATFPLGRMLDFGDPHYMLDRKNELHVIQEVSPRVWGYFRVGINGESLERSTYIDTKTRPHLKKSPEGNVTVVGGQMNVPVAPVTDPSVPKLSDRPAGFRVP